MAAVPFKKPVEDSVSKVNNEIAVGEDLNFQRKWWRFEKIIWTIFTAIVILDLLGAFGRGYLAHNRIHTPDNVLDMKYDRIARFDTPSNMSVSFGPGAVRDGKVQLFVSQSVISDLGAQRISPQPQTSTVGNGGALYTFDATRPPAIVQIAFQSSKPGLHHITVQVPGTEALHARVLVMP